MPKEPEKASAQDFTVLGLTPDSSPARVKKAYRDLVKLWHPDRFEQRPSSDRRKAEERLKGITTSYRRISRGWKHQEPAERKPESPTGRQAKHEAAPRSTPRRPTPEPTMTASPAHGKHRLFGFLLLLLLLAYFVTLTPVPRWLSFQVGSSSLPDMPPIASRPPSTAARNWPPKGMPPADREAQTAALPSPGDTPYSPPLFLNRSSRSHFTLGSTDAEVIAIQGFPSRIQGQTWNYGLSEVQFKDGRVWRYNNFDGSLRVRLDPPGLPHDEMPQYFTLGSSRNDVLLVQGTPTRIDTQSWFYGFSEIRFKNGRVESYDNYFGNLRIRMLPPDSFRWTSPRDYFTVGSTKDEVLVVQGTPTSVQGNLWFYQLSNVLFRNGRVQSVVNSGGILRFVPPEEPG